jgi:hypothetical protein
VRINVELGVTIYDFELADKSLRGDIEFICHSSVQDSVHSQQCACVKKMAF